MNKYNWSALCRLKTEGWKSPVFRIQFHVFDNDEADAYTHGRMTMALTRQNTEYQKVEVTLLEEGVKDADIDEVYEEDPEMGETGLRTLEGLRSC